MPDGCTALTIRIDATAQAVDMPVMTHICMNGTKLSPSGTSAMRQFIESEEEGWLGIG